MKTNYIFYFAFLSALFFLCFVSVAQSAQGAPRRGTPVTFNYGDGLTWSGELGQSVHVEYSVNDKISQRDGTLSKVATRYIYVGTHGISIKNIILIQNSETTTGESPPTAAPPNESSSEVSKDEKDNEGSDWVVVRGVGITSDEAKQDAWRNAIEHVAGVYITANSLIENGKLVKDVITSHSNAFIEEFQLLEEDIEGGVVRVRIKARVATKSVFEKLQSSGGKLEFRSVDGESKYAKIVTQKQQIKSAIESLPAAIEGYPEALFDIEIGETRMAIDGVFKDGMEHLIVPITFSWNSRAWTTFANNLKQYLMHVSNDTSSFRLMLQRIKHATEGNGSATGQGYVRGDTLSDGGFFNKWYEMGWERTFLGDDDGDSYVPLGLIFDKTLKGMYDEENVVDQVLKAYTHDPIKDVVVILNSSLRSGNSFAVSRDIWDSLQQSMKQAPAFYLHAMTSDDTEIGEPFSESEFHYSTMRPIKGSSIWFRNSARSEAEVYSLPYATGLRRVGNSNNSKLQGSISSFDSGSNPLDRSKEHTSPRVMILSPYFRMKINRGGFNAGHPFWIPKYELEYIINLELDEVKELDRVEIETYVLDLHNKRRRDNGSQ